MKNTHVNIPVFIPHLGCPNMCVFCNQRAISGVCSFIPHTARETIERVLGTTEKEGITREIAFFGGSFTGIDRELMISLLDLAEEYVRAGRVSGIRMSTRPDYIDDEIVNILKKYTISAVELGIQSFSDDVLAASKRGHTVVDSENAMKLLVNAGFSVVGQMMIGLPSSSIEDEVRCARKIAELGASAARIYPTIVFRDTELCEMMHCGQYVPLSLEEAVQRSAAVLEVFAGYGVECLRIGLCESENLHSDESFVAGPNHPSLGELVYGEVYYRVLCRELDKIPTPEIHSFAVEVPTGDLSMAIGQKKRNKIRIENKYQIKNIKFIENSALTRYNIMIALKK